MSLARLGGNRALGHLQITGPDGTVTVDTFTCAHCNRQVACEIGADVGKVCVACFSMICIPCVKLQKCDPFEKKLLEMEAKARFRQTLGE